jgi:MEMO1 family protein
MNQSLTHNSAYAGSFYPGTEMEIRKMLEVIRDRAGQHGQTPHPPILILPHAGWIYSGLAAIRGLSTLTDNPPTRIAMIGPSHRLYFLGFSLDGYAKYQTPLGELTVDSDLFNELSDFTGFEFEEPAHSHEHSLEVIIPMIQFMIPGDRKILPILAGSASKADISKLADGLAAYLDPMKDVLIVSSDLSHFYTYDEARILDQKTVDIILDADVDALLTQSGEGGRLACGFAGIATAIELSKQWSLEKPQLLIYYNSGDSGGDRNSVVGYAAIAYPPPKFEV